VIKTARLFGITSPLGNHLSLALGTAGVSPLELASAYSVIANLGVYNKPYFIQRIEDFEGNPIYENFYHGVQRFPQKSVYPLLDMMQGVVDGGTGNIVRRMGFKHPAAGKTGTSNNSKDAWFNGFTKDFSASVWVGYDDNEPMIGRSGRGLTGGGAAAPIWVLFMKKVLQGKNKIKFPVPDGIKFEKVDARSGTLPDGQSVETMNVALKEEEIIPPRMLELEKTQLGQASVNSTTTSE
jgi:penicillin-binding protein 1A